MGVVLATSFLGFVSSGESEAVYSVGSGDDDWWITYSDQHPDAGSEVDHPQWVLDALDEKPVVILTHSDGCKGCVNQDADMKAVLEDYGDDVVYLDLRADGSDQKADEALSIYDPDHGVTYIPLTIVVTLIQDSEGSVEVGWHSVEGASDEDWIRSYVEDAINYYDENVADWDK